MATKKKKAAKKKGPGQHKSAVDGQFKSAEYSEEHEDTTYKVGKKKRKK